MTDPATLPPSPAAFTPAPEIHVMRKGTVGHIVLDRPKALNALSLPMIATIDHTLAAWSGDDGIRAVIVSGGERAFCAGGDVRALWEFKRDNGDRPEAVGAAVAAYFQAEYRMNHRINTYPKPYIALIDGITMGGGAGLSLHGSHRVATETTLLAMPETAIGIFPDVGATWFLNRCPGYVGTWLALTGARFGAADALWAGMATQFVPRAQLAALVDALVAALANADDAYAATDTVLAGFAADAGPSAAADLQPVIDHCFGANSVEAIITRLNETGTPWAAEQMARLASMAPTSLKLALEQLRGGQHLDIAAALRREFRMICNSIIGRPDYDEGIRALLIDKDKTPRWSPPTLAEVDWAIVTAQFAAIPGQPELSLP
jgi:enoyl-CoA hydratase